MYFDLKILKFDEQLEFQLSSLMWDYDHNVLPTSLTNYFKRANLIHNYKTRTASIGKLYYSKVNTIKYGIKSFKYQGIGILNNLKNLDVYKDTGSKTKLLKDLKSSFILKYNN